MSNITRKRHRKMKTKGVHFFAAILFAANCLGIDYRQYLAEENNTYALIPEKRGELLVLRNTGSQQERRGANALLAFEAVVKAEKTRTYDFDEAEQFANAAIITTTNDWINICARLTLISSHNLKRNQDSHANVTNALSLLQDAVDSVWEVPENPFYSTGRGSGHATAAELREVLAIVVIGNYCSLYRFDEAEAFLKTFPDSHWRREAEKQLVLQREQHAFSREEARQIRSREKARRERTP